MERREEECEKLLVLADMLLRLKLLDDLLDIALAIDRKAAAEAKGQAELESAVFHQTKAHRLRKDESAFLIELCTC